MAYQKVLKILGISATAVIVAGLGVYKFHPHSYKMVDSTDPTCTLGGHKTYECWCGDEYTENIEPTGHGYEETDTEPTCIEDGEKTLTCKRCGVIYSEKISALGHKYVNGVCVQCGEKDPSVNEEDTDLVQNPEDKDLIADEEPDKSNDKPSKSNQPKQPTEQSSVQPTPAPQPQPTPIAQPSTSYVDDDGLPRGSDADMAAAWGAEVCDNCVGNCTFDDGGIVWE